MRAIRMSGSTISLIPRSNEVSVELSSVSAGILTSAIKQAVSTRRGDAPWRRGR